MAAPKLRLCSNGYYYVFWSHRRRSKRRSLKTGDWEEAVKRFALWRGRGTTEPVFSRVTPSTVADCWAVYDEKHVRTEAVMPRGQATIASAWKRLEPAVGHLLVPQLDQGEIDRYVAQRRRHGAAPATIRIEISYLLAALKFCASSRGGKIINKTDIETIELPRNSPPRDRWLTMEEVQKLLDAAAELRRKDGRLTRAERFLWLALFTAAREEALLQLTWDRVDFATNTIHLNVPGRRLTKKRRADVTIATQLRTILERAYRERKTHLVLDNERSVYGLLQTVATKAGVERPSKGRSLKSKSTGISPHVFRHTAATHMARNDVPMWKIAHVLGNSLQITERVYAKWQPGNPEETVDRISRGVLRAPD